MPTIKCNFHISVKRKFQEVEDEKKKQNTETNFLRWFTIHTFKDEKKTMYNYVLHTYALLTKIEIQTYIRHFVSITPQPKI